MDNTTPYGGTGATWEDVLAAPSEPPVEDLPPEPARRGLALAKGAGLVAAGLLVGTLAVGAAQAATRDDGTTAAATTSAGSTADDQLGGPQPSDGDRGGSGGNSGERRLSGTLIAVGSSTVTVRGAAGTATYAVTGATDIRRDGQQVALSSLKAGDAVLVHVLPTSSGFVAERILAGSSSEAPAVTGTGRAT